MTASKVGLDDFLVRGGSLADLGRYAVSLTSFETDRDADQEPEPYEATADGLLWHRPMQTGTVPVRLTNFTAMITTEIVEDDGAETRRLFALEALLNGQLRRFTVPHDRFQAMTWVIEQLGGTAIVFPGQSTKEHARTAIQILSGDIPVERVYAHTGWREIDGQSIYLTGRGGIGPSGFVDGIAVQLPPALSHFSLPAPPTGDALVAAITASFGLLGVVPIGVSAPLYAALWRSVLGSADFGVHLVGRTNAGKTALAALVQQHFGAEMNARHLPGSWSSTGNALEGLAFHVKDAVLVVDDFAPHGTTNDMARMHRDADRVFRAAGNNSARGRMRADGTLRTPRPPRGLILSTGEDVPRGQSLRSRVLILEIEPRATDWAQMTRCQQAADRGLFAQAMSGFIAWLAGTPQWRSDLAERRAELTHHVQLHTDIKRTVATTIELGAALSLFLEFAVDVGALTDDQAKMHWQRCWRAIRDAARGQSEHLAESEPTTQFGTYLMAAIASGKAHLTDRDGAAPVQPEAWGWVSDGDDRRVARGDRIGWLVAGHIYLEPTAAYAVAQGMAQRHGEALGLGAQQLWKRLAAKGFLASRDTTRRTNTIRRTLAGQSRTVLHIMSALLTGLPPHPDADKSDITSMEGPVMRSAVSTSVGTDPDDALGADTEDGRSDAGNAATVGFVSTPTPSTGLPARTPAGASTGSVDLSGTRNVAVANVTFPLPAATPESDPPRTCYVCKSNRFYSDGICQICHPRDWLSDGRPS
jgi:hypothetical protein